MDLDGDGYVDEREFQAYMMAAHRGMIGKKTVGGDSQANAKEVFFP